MKRTATISLFALAVVCFATGSNAVDSSFVAKSSNEGFLQACEDTSSGTSGYRIGPRYMLQRIIVHDSTGNTVSFSKEPFTEAVVREQIDRILYRLETAGYYFASAVIEDVSGSDTNLTVHLVVTRGPLVYAGGYQLGGLNKTHPALVERYLPQIAGEPLTPSLMHEVEGRAERIPFLTYVAPAEIRPKEGYTRADVELVFIERRQFHLEGIVGYVPSTSGGLLWSIDARFQNILGGGRDAAVRSERRESGRNLLEINYSQPVFFAGVGLIGGQVATRDYRDQFYEFALKARYEMQVSPRFGTQIQMGWRNVEPSTSLSAYRVLTVGFGASAGNRGNRLRELPNYSLDWTVTYSYRRYRDDSLSIAPERIANNETRTTLKLAATLPVYRALASHVSTSYWGYETAETLPPISELFFLGGPGTIRGFRNEQFLAQRAAMVVLEPRLRFSEGFVYAFVDGAYINVPEGDINIGVVTEESLEWGYGFGIDLRNDSRAVNLSLGWNRELAFDEPRLSIQLISDI